MKDKGGATSQALRTEFARAAFSLTASYDAAISKYLNAQSGDLFPDRVSLAIVKENELRYGENPHQKGAFYKLADSQEVSVGNAKLLDGGTPISFNNLMDTNAAFELVKEFDGPAAVVVKHMNPCGCAMDDDICKAYEKAYLGDVVSAFGGIGRRRRRLRHQTNALGRLNTLGLERLVAVVIAAAVLAEPGLRDLQRIVRRSERQERQERPTAVAIYADRFDDEIGVAPGGMEILR